MTEEACASRRSRRSLSGVQVRLFKEWNTWSSSKTRELPPVARRPRSLLPIVVSSKRGYHPHGCAGLDKSPAAIVWKEVTIDRRKSVLVPNVFFLQQRSSVTCLSWATWNIKPGCRRPLLSRVGAYKSPGLQRTIKSVNYYHFQGHGKYESRVRSPGGGHHAEKVGYVLRVVGKSFLRVVRGPCAQDGSISIERTKSSRERERKKRKVGLTSSFKLQAVETDSMGNCPCA